MQKTRDFFNKFRIQWDPCASGATTVLSAANDMPSAYQQLLEHTSAMLQPAMHANLTRSTLPPPPPGLLGWTTGPALPTALPQPLEEVNGECKQRTIILYTTVTCFILLPARRRRYF